MNGLIQKYLTLMSEATIKSVWIAIIVSMSIANPKKLSTFLSFWTAPTSGCVSWVVDSVFLPFFKLLISLAGVFTEAG